MTRELADCPVPGCVDGQGKPRRFKALLAHFRNSHPDLDPRGYGIDVPEAKRPEAVAAAAPPADERRSEPPAAAAAVGADLPANPPNDLEAVILQLAAQNTQLAAQNEKLQAAFVALNERVGQQTQAHDAFQQSVLKGFNDIPKMVEHSLSARLDQMVVQAQQQQQQPSDISGAGMAAPGAAVPAMPGQGARPGIMEVLALLAPILSPQQPQNGMGQIVEQINGLGQLMNTIASMQRAPWMEGAKFVTDVFATGAKIGLTPEQTGLSMGKTLQDMGGQPGK